MKAHNKTFPMPCAGAALVPFRLVGAGRGMGFQTKGRAVKTKKKKKLNDAAAGAANGGKHPITPILDAHGRDGLMLDGLLIERINRLVKPDGGTALKFVTEAVCGYLDSYETDQGFRETFDFTKQGEVALTVRVR